MQDGIVIDSSAWSILVYPQHPRHREIKEIAQELVNYVPTAVVGELFYGAFKQPARVKIRVREIINRLKPFGILRPDIDICRIWGELSNQRKMNFGENKLIKDYTDIWIAATAKRFGFPILTLNPDDFNWIENLEVLPNNTI